MIDKKVVRELVKEIKEADQQYLNDNHFDSLNDSQQYNQIGQMGLAHQFICQQYKKEAFNLGQLEQIL